MTVLNTVVTDPTKATKVEEEKLVVLTYFVAKVKKMKNYFI